MGEIISDIEVLDQKQAAEACDLEDAKVSIDKNTGKPRKMYLESYGCQMNFSDSEIVTSIMSKEGFDTTSDYHEADIVFLNTCSIRENAEQKVRNRLKHINAARKQKPDMLIGILGCMAERLKSKLLDQEKVVDMVVGPDAYRDLPKLIKETDEGGKGVNVFLSKEETYADISPVRVDSNGVSAFISIMRGCDNMCSFCVVPFTRGRERSRDPYSIVQEAQELTDKGYKEVTLLGQNVDSYKWENKESGEQVDFVGLLEKVALIDPNLRVRFSTSHPKDITDEVLYTMRRYDNICKYIHLPAQCGSSRVLALMNRTYTREWYMERVDAIRRILGEDCGISSDMIAGFCTETEEEHQQSLSLMRYAQYDFSYMFAYSERPGTLAAKRYEDDIPVDVKKRRLNEIIGLQGELSKERNKRDIYKVHTVLVEGTSKKSTQDLKGRNSQNKMVVFPAENYKPGQYVDVYVEDCTQATLKGKALGLSQLN